MLPQLSPKWATAKSLQAITKVSNCLESAPDKITYSSVIWHSELHGYTITFYVERWLLVSSTFMPISRSKCVDDLGLAAIAWDCDIRYRREEDEDVKEFKEGYAAYLAPAVTNNPYSEGTFEYDDWADGWALSKTEDLSRNTNITLLQQLGLEEA